KAWLITEIFPRLYRLAIPSRILRRPTTGPLPPTPSARSAHGPSASASAAWPSLIRWASTSWLPCVAARNSWLFDHWCYLSLCVGGLGADAPSQKFFVCRYGPD